MKNYSRRTFLRTSAALGAGAVLSNCSSGLFVSHRPQFDILIKNAAIIDGNGSPEFLADVGIRDGVIQVLSKLETTDALRIIDATGLKVVPGFIDIHTHTDSSILSLPTADSKLRQGVTTEIGGADGSSRAPRKKSSEDDVDAYTFSTMDNFFSTLQKKGCAQNVASMIGLGTIREFIVGEDDRPATAEEMELMRREVLQAIEQGCCGVSTGLEYTPGSFASTEELWELTKVVPEKYRVYATHMRNEDNRLLEAIDEVIKICRHSGARLQVSHLKASYKINWYKQKIVLKMLDDAIAEGIEVHADRYPYVAYQTGMSSLFPLWARDGGTDQFMARLRDRSLSEKIKTDVMRKINGLGSWDSIMITSVKNEARKSYQGKTIQKISEDLHVDPFDFTVDLMLQENATTGIVGFGMDEAGTEMCLRWKNTMVASDGGAYSPASPSNPHPRTYGTFPRAIAHYQKERNICSLPEMIRKMTSMPAQKIGLKDRGVIAEGKAADIVLFNYGTIKDNATYVEPHQFPTGIPYVIINGVLAVDDNKITGKLPGRVLRNTDFSVVS
ncbi:MAG: amidohydrolase family protein [Bacteroidota bacterium]|nr:amidohydrolase family protein [Bacteroidota bacterium]